MTTDELRERFWTAWDNCLDSPNHHTAPSVSYNDLWEELLPDIIKFAKEYNPSLPAEKVIHIKEKAKQHADKFIANIRITSASLNPMRDTQIRLGYESGYEVGFIDALNKKTK